VESRWYENGQKQAEISFKDGKREGVAKYWDENGNLTTKLWKDGVEVK
jgi:antitoxin component YwqK of YwqJK toxin-antitoxin module